ncbi:hypothetical protein KIH86_17390 [Paenibacillus sp. HN-1]|uniref:hypothetical protein n=1 Tax=Paenibacillus TaxID=44249 RepID=UPI001CA7C0FA|nr:MULTISPECIES: hypothetical protein [Paenibacillus]MBY9081857.1 hypothetical protein [Paenibacillus sp. CGMCC 1.18879]MBY9085985.1 hypothetical protein [Paenibacillus sinensis]
MKHKWSTAAIAGIVTALLLSGCTPLPGKSAEDKQESSGNSIEEAARSIGETVSQGVSNAVDSAAKVARNTSDLAVDRLNASGMKKEIVYSTKVGSGTALRVENSVGDIEVKRSSGSQLKISATVTAYKTISRQDHRQEILDHAVVEAKESGGEWTVSTHSSEDADTDLWTWANREYDTSDLTISYVIEVPDSLNQFTIRSDVGRINTRGLTGAYDVTSEVGSIDVNDAHIAGDSIINTDTGAITLDLSGLDSDSKLKVNSEVGSITASLASSVKCTLEAHAELGGVHGVSSGKSDINGGGALVTLNSSVGSIKVSK